jgi:hypothetical protein
MRWALEGKTSFCCFLKCFPCTHLSSKI